MDTINLAACFPYFLCFPYAVAPTYIPKSLEAPEEHLKKKYKRTWTRDQVAELVKRTELYILAKQRSKESLDVIDFQIIAEGLPQTPAQSYTKMREVFANGTLQPGVWTVEEDSQLRDIVLKGVDKWNQIAKRLNAMRYQGRKIRTGKQCKERWNNHLNPAIKHGNWTLAEDLELLESYRSLGKQWSNIAKRIVNRTESSVKNRIKSLINKEMQCIDLKHDPEAALASLIAKRKGGKLEESPKKRVKIE
mmetsp:Transcript_32977/g.57945  ORF Transcript_32977/g.57945 Transcript_32977/m.57945 type:complete len:249 (+) Transcript_32977:3285-4031(+)